MTDAVRRERARLRSERWRRAQGIMPRRPAQKPWLAEGISRSSWYRRGNRIGQTHNLASIKRSGVSVLLTTSCTRAETFVRELQAELAEVARHQAIMAGIIGEMAAATVEQEMIATGRVPPWLR
jgi:hypothetical protein